MLTKINWTHPTKGDIEETVCDKHKAALEAALHTLGMGYTGGDALVDQCYRCLYDGYPFWSWIDIL